MHNLGVFHLFILILSPSFFDCSNRLCFRFGVDLFSAYGCRGFFFFFLVGGVFTEICSQVAFCPERRRRRRRRRSRGLREFLRELWGECAFGTAAVGCGVESRWEVWRKYRDGEFLLKSGETSCERAKRWIEQ